VLTLVGTNDARRHGATTTAPLVSREETARNLELIRDFLAERTTARRLWMTPPPVREELIATDRRFRLNEQTWDDAELAARVALTHALGEPTLDLAPAFGRPCPPELLLADGLHPSLAGQVRILRAVTERLSLDLPVRGRASAPGAEPGGDGGAFG
jgi:lysophospholipase L1-like esterase